MEEVSQIIGIVVIVVIVLVVLSFVMALPTMWLWNWLMPDLFGLAEITFWQALGINMLCSMLFKSSGSSSSKKS